MFSAFWSVSCPYSRLPVQTCPGRRGLTTPHDRQLNPSVVTSSFVLSQPPLQFIFISVFLNGARNRQCTLMLLYCDTHTRTLPVQNEDRHTSRDCSGSYFSMYTCYQYPILLLIRVDTDRESRRAFVLVQIDHFPFAVYFCYQARFVDFDSFRFVS